MIIVACNVVDKMISIQNKYCNDSFNFIFWNQRSVSVARLNWAADKPRTEKLDLDEDEAKERRTGDTFNPKKDPSLIISTTPKGKKRVAVIPNTSGSTPPSSTTRGSPNARRIMNNPTNEMQSSGSSPNETPLCSPSLKTYHTSGTNTSKTMTTGSNSPSRMRPKLGLLKAQSSTSFDNTFDSTRTFEGSDTLDYATDNYLSDISCDITE